MAKKDVVEHLFRLLPDANDQAKEQLLRCLLNLSLDAECENLIREVGGLEELMSIYSSSATSQAVLFQATRVLFNLVGNSRNRELMIEKGIVERTVERFTSATDADNFELQIRLANMLGVLASADSLSVAHWKQISAKSTGEAFAGLLDFLSGNSEAANTVKIAVLGAVAKILRERNGEEYSSAVLEGFREGLAQCMPALSSIASQLGDENPLAGIRVAPQV